MQYSKKMRKFYILTFIGIFIGVSTLVYATHTKVEQPIKPKSPAIKTGYHIDKNFDLIPNDKNGNRKVVLLTIDDGPNKNDKEFVRILAMHKAQAIFFINGIHDKDNTGNIKMLASAGHTIGNHTWSHPNLQKINNSDSIKKEIDTTTKLIKAITSQNPRFFRPPFGASTPYVRDLVKKDGMIYMNWSGAAKDWEKNTKEEKVFLKNVETDLHNGEILLLHGHPWTVKYLDDLMTTLEAKGYTFLDPKEITY